MAITYKKITEVDAAAALNDSDELIINSAGALKRAPKSLLGLAQLRSDVDAKAEIADDVLDTAHALSGRRTVDLLCRRDTVSGAVASGHFVPGYPLDYKAYVAAVQSGTGDPTPANVRPIVGHDSMALTRCGAITDSTADGYIGDSYTIALSTITDAQGAAIGTQFDGYVDSARGKFVQTSRRIVIDGVQIKCSALVHDKANRAYIVIPCVATAWSKIDAVCTHYAYNKDVYLDASKTTGFCTAGNAIMMRFGDDSDLTTAAAANAWFSAQLAAGTPVTVNCVLAAPVEYDAAGLPVICALDGVTSLLSNSGNVALTGAIDPRWDIDQLRAAIVALGGTI